MNAEPKIKGGYIIFPREFIDTFAGTPLLDRVLLTYLYCKASHKASPSSNGLNRGQLLTTIKQLQQAASYPIGYRCISPGIGQLRKTLRRLQESNTIEFQKTTRGLLVTICNYSFYQDPQNYESPHEATTKEHTKDKNSAHYIQECNKNDKNVINNSNKASFSFSSSQQQRPSMSFDQQDRLRAQHALEQAKKEFLADEQK